MDTFTIGDQPVGPGEPTFIIAEAGSNHNGDLETAKELIDIAVDAGADAVKFQTFRAEESYVEDSGKIEYIDDDRSIYEIIESMEMPYEWIPELHDYCAERDIYFLSTALSEQSAEQLAEYVPVWKIASLTSSHHPFVRYLAQTEKPIIMSTGAHEFDEVRENVEVLQEAGAESIALLQCVAAYPTPLEDANVSVIETFAEEFGVVVGYSDHTLDPVTAPAAAVAVGAGIIEKHFTLDKDMEGPDHEFALEPEELAEMVTAVRDTEAALGTGQKAILDVESEIHTKARRAVHAVDDISAGEELSSENLKILRPGEQEAGLHPKYYDELLGKTAARDIQKSTGVQWDDVEGHGS
jgi:N-acetylneuraminate synthase